VAKLYETLIVERLEGGVGLVKINRPDKRNALNQRVIDELVEALTSFDNDEAIGAVVLTGDEKAFAAGADIAEMAGRTAAEMLLARRFEQLERLRRLDKPLVAAVSGYALGGGLELAMLCDMIVASQTAKLGQPEINLGIMPGAGGTQRLTRQVGKYLAMEMVLAGRLLTAEEALRFGLVNRVAPVERYLDEAIALARNLAARAPLAVRLAKSAVLRAQDLSLEHGLALERQAYYLLFGTEDKEEGVKAFLEGREPGWKGR
jgi:enoyl-CoA hydratase